MSPARRTRRAPARRARRARSCSAGSSAAARAPARRRATASRRPPGGRSPRACRGGRQPLRAARRVVGVRLRRVAEVRLEVPAVARERQPEVMQALEDDRGAVLELRAARARTSATPVNGRRPPGEVGRVARDGRARLHEPEARRPDGGLGDQPLDVPGGEEVVEPAFLLARDDERLLLPVLREEALGLDRRDRAVESRGASRASVSSESESVLSESSASPSVVSVSSPSESPTTSDVLGTRADLLLVECVLSSSICSLPWRRDLPARRLQGRVCR